MHVKRYNEDIDGSYTFDIIRNEEEVVLTGTISAKGGQKLDTDSPMVDMMAMGLTKSEIFDALEMFQSLKPNPV